MRAGHRSELPNMSMELAPFLRYSMVLIIALISIMASSCQKRDTPSKADAGTAAASSARLKNILRLDVNSPLKPACPGNNSCSASSVTFPLIYSNLFVPNDDRMLEPDLAVTWSYDKAGYKWTIVIRKDAVWHDGRHVTADDVEYSLVYCLSANLATVYSFIDKITVTGPDSLCIFLKGDDPSFLYKIWRCEIFPRPNKVEADLITYPVGSGPFKFISRNGEREIVLSANEHYYNGKPSIDRIIFHYEPDKDKSWERLLAGLTDIIFDVSPKEFDLIRKYSDRFYFNQKVSANYTLLLYNNADPLFTDPRVRLAMAYAIDKEAIIERFLNGHAVVATGPIGVGSDYQNPAVGAVSHNPKKALELLGEAGWSRNVTGGRLSKDGKPFEFTIFTFEENPLYEKVVRYIQLFLGDIGIEVHHKAMPSSELVKRYTQNNLFQAVLTEFRGVYDDDDAVGSLAQIWCPMDGKKSFAGGFEDCRATDILRKLVWERDPLKRRELFYKIDERISSLQPCTFLYQKMALDIMSKRVELSSRFGMDQRGLHNLWRASIKAP